MNNTDLFATAAAPLPTTDPFAAYRTPHAAGPTVSSSATTSLPYREHPYDENDDAWHLIDHLMRGLPGPDGYSAPLGITWHAGQVTGAPFWRKHLADFRQPIRHNTDYGSLSLRSALGLKVARLHTIGEQMELGRGLVSRIVYDFLVSVVYACETWS
jgi:hypothetical protein